MDGVTYSGRESASQRRNDRTSYRRPLPRPAEAAGSSGSSGDGRGSAPGAWSPLAVRRDVGAIRFLGDKLHDLDNLVLATLAPGGVDSERLGELDVHPVALQGLCEMLAHPVVDLGDVS